MGLIKIKADIKRLSGAWRDDAGSLATSLKKQGKHQVDVIEGQMRDKPLLSLLARLRRRPPGLAPHRPPLSGGAGEMLARKVHERLAYSELSH